MTSTKTVSRAISSASSDGSRKTHCRRLYPRSSLVSLAISFCELEDRLTAATTKIVTAEKQLATLTKQEVRFVAYAHGQDQQTGSNTPMDQLVHPLARQYQLEIQS